jgi:hypothetical protein
LTNDSEELYHLKGGDNKEELLAPANEKEEVVKLDALFN